MSGKVIVPADTANRHRTDENWGRYNAAVPDQYFRDPVVAYDHLASAYAELSQGRSAYLNAVEAQILCRVDPDARSLLDIGTGDGTRARRMAAAAGIARIVLVEPSAGMSAGIPGDIELWRSRAEDLHPSVIPERFDVITCLWNSLGHVVSTEKRIRVLDIASRLLSRDGLLFVDVSHRYNAPSYGFVASWARWMQDKLASGDESGDVHPTWTTSGGSISTYGHVFTHREMVRLAKAAGLLLRERVVVDYQSGRIRRLPWCGNLLYVFCRNSRMESSSAPATS